MARYRYLPMHMHIHTCFQSGASMESQMYQAKKLGMEYIRFTDHDSTLGRKFTPHIDFSRHELEYVDENGISVRFEPIGDGTLSFEESGMCVRSEKEGGFSLWTRQHWHIITLLSGLTFVLKAKVKSGKATLAFPVPEEAFLDSIRCGRLYTGDPVQFRGKLDFSCGVYPMGAILPYTDKSACLSHAFRFQADRLTAGWILRLVADGEELSSFVIEKDTVDVTVEFTPIHAVSFVRAELYDEAGRCILLTNPIYMVNTDHVSRPIPSHRLYGGQI